MTMNNNTGPATTAGYDVLAQHLVLLAEALGDEADRLEDRARMLRLQCQIVLDAGWQRSGVYDEAWDYGDPPEEPPAIFG
jgi:hypothetical protein